jgi:hypothetical protein
LHLGDCVRLADGRIGRVRKSAADHDCVRVRRTTSKTHQLVTVRVGDLRRIECPPGWMSPTGYRRYLKVTLAKMRKRLARAK